MIRSVASLVLIAYALAFGHVAVVLHEATNLEQGLADAQHEQHCVHADHLATIDAPRPEALVHADDHCDAFHFVQSSARLQQVSTSMQATAPPEHTELTEQVAPNPPVALLSLAPKSSPPARG